jgi:phenylalanyl-tRNA synthetase beta chain
MKVSENWLREWVNPALDGQQLASLLTMAGLEVDAINPVAGQFDHVIVAHVINVQSHPQADKLSLCEINTGKNPLLKVVCGAQNVRPGLKVALAQVGATLPGGLLIKESQLRGELSQGMLCSAAELGLLDSAEGIIELDDDAPIGMDLRDYLSLNDQVLDIDLTPNRADCLSVIGVAREIAALTQLPLRAAPAESVVPEIDEQKNIQLQASEACPHYCGRIIRNINSQAVTPLWMRERLRRSGIRSIHPVVDVTNYVMLELGQPLHVFDLNKLKGDMIVRYSHDNEAIELLDGQQITLKENVLVIADSKSPLAIAGVMGGSVSAVDETTMDVFLESAYFNPVAIAGVARRYGLFTDSSQRFERGVSPELQMMALERASALLLEIAGGNAGPLTEVVDAKHLPRRNPVAFNPAKVKQLTGLDIDEATMKQMLQGLGMSVTKGDLYWEVTIPTHRFDLRLDVDLIEEIIRLYGYDKIPGDKMITTVQAGVINPYESLSLRLNHFFTARGYHETISYSFVDPELQDVLYPEAQPLTLLNPISSELSRMRVGIWSGLLASMIYNIHRQQMAIKFFENGVVFELSDGKIVEKACFGGLLTGESGAMSWNEGTRKYDFYDMKGDLQALFSSLQLNDVSFESSEHEALHPGKSARMLVDNQPIGWCGVLHPRITEALDLHEEVILFELKLEALLSTKAPRYQQISKFPQIRRDLSLLVDENITVSQLQNAVRATVNQNWLKSFDVFDVYTGESIPAGKKSLAVALTLQDDNRTLVDHEINEVISAIIKKLGDEFAITLRD